MAYTTIKKPSDYFNTKLYTGTGSSNAVTGVGFQPDWTWIKSRSNAYEHKLYDAVRGATKELKSDNSNAESTDANGLTSFDSDGFTLGTTAGVNGSSATFASWNWLADNTSGSSNTDGSITSTVSANTTSGFSIVSYTGTATAGTLGHGLSAVPKMIILKDRTSTRDWFVYHNSIGNNNRLKLNDTVASGATTIWNTTTPTSSVFSIDGDVYANASGNNYIAYCFAEKKGFSKFGSYTGNGSVSDSSSAVDGTFVYTGFKPSFIMWKNSSNAGAHWIMVDNKRSPFNKTTAGQSNGEPHLGANRNNAEETTEAHVDLLSNGFKFRSSSNNNFNYTGQTYIYMAFAESPFTTSTGIPTTAR